jgi:pyridoxine/pyridoxamine 5'-phosphate oxidase
MTRQELLAFLRRYRIAVEATVGRDGAPQAAVVGIAVSDELELIFDTLESTRKCANLRSNPRVALVVGWDEEATAQIDGVAYFPAGEALERARACYFSVYPDGRERLAWPGITHVVVKPERVRFSDFAKDPAFFAEFGPEVLRR